MTLKPYPKYKDTGLPWLEMIPSHWKVRRAKYVFNVIDVRSETGKEELLTVSASAGVVPRSEMTVTMFMAKSYVGHKLCWPGDLVINSLWAWMQGLGFARHYGIVSSAYSVYRPQEEFSKSWQYLDYLLRSKAYMWELKVRSKGVWISRLQLLDDVFFDMPIILPPEDECQAIVRYLATKYLGIRRFIRAKRRLLEMLNEQKQAIINRAVTRGMDPNVPLKYSSIDWLGDIPEHWEFKRLKHLLARPLKYGANAAAELTDRNLPRYIRITDIDKSGRLIDERFRSIRPELAEPYILENGDILLARSGATVGKAFLYSAEHGPASYAGYLINARVDQGQILPAYLYTVLQSAGYWQWIASMTIQATIQNVNAEKYADFCVPVPPLPEQEALLHHIRSEISVLEKIMYRAQREIDLISEYRTRLIADVVTGKVDVRHLAPETTEAEQENLDEDIEDEMPGEDDVKPDDEVIDADD